MHVKSCNHSAHKSPSSRRLDWALEQFKALRLRITNPRKEILAVLAKAVKPLSSEEVFAELKKDNDLVTVYRSLTTMEDAGLLRRYEFGDGVRRYELSQEQEHHHHYIRCRECGDLEAFDGCDFEDTLARLLAKKGYQMIRHTLDVQALCRACQA
jgi:Fur family ferric uptake transcriptional regulator